MPRYTPFITKLFYSNKTVQQDSVLILDTDVRANHWGPAPFIMACAENLLSPKFPDGESREWIEKNLLCDVLNGGIGVEGPPIVSIPLERDIVR